MLEIFKGFKVLVEKHSVSHGITYEPSAPYTQHQNGVSERTIRTVMERARTILIESQLEDHFCAEAVNTSVYLHNRRPTKALHGTTPYEAWHGSKPPLEHLRRFGCDAYVYVPDQRRKKLDPKSRLCVHLGYVHNTTKLWHVWDLQSRRVIHVADVVFNEKSFGGRSRTQTSLPLSTLLRDEVDYTVTCNVSPQQSTESIIQKDASEVTSSYDGTSSASLPEPCDLQPTTQSGGCLEVNDTSGGRFMNALEDRVGDSDAPIPGTQNDDSSMPMDLSTLRSMSRNGMAPEEGESVAFDSTAPDGHQSPAQRKSKRVRKPSFWLRDSVTFAVRASEHEQPQTYNQALEQPDSCKWVVPIREEFKSHVDNSTWELAELPPGKNHITCKWVFKLKTNADASTRYKAHLVIREFEQVYGIDYGETFAPVAKRLLGVFGYAITEGHIYSTTTIESTVWLKTGTTGLVRRYQ